MKQVILDGSAITTRTQFHDAVAQQLQLPEWYGRNLDALYDLLSTCPPTVLTLTNASALKEMFRYGDNLRLALEDAARDNPNLTLILED